MTYVVYTSYDNQYDMAVDIQQAGSGQIVFDSLPLHSILIYIVAWERKHRLSKKKKIWAEISYNLISQKILYIQFYRLSDCFNTLRPRQNGCHFADDIFKCIFLNENVWIPIKISLKFVPKGPINNIPALVLIMAWGRPGNKPLSGPMMVRLLTHICITRPQWVKSTRPSDACMPQ